MIIQIHNERKLNLFENSFIFQIEIPSDRIRMQKFMLEIFQQII